MTISELMTRLAALQAQYGDIPVEVGYTMVDADEEEYSYRDRIISCDVSRFDPERRVTLLTDIIVREEWDEDDD